MMRIAAKEGVELVFSFLCFSSEPEERQQQHQQQERQQHQQQQEQRQEHYKRLHN